MTNLEQRREDARRIDEYMKRHPGPFKVSKEFHTIHDANGHIYIASEGEQEIVALILTQFKEMWGDY